jgi:hypothetical protein
MHQQEDKRLADRRSSADAVKKALTGQSQAARTRRIDQESSRGIVRLCHV